MHSQPGLPQALYPVLIECASSFNSSASNFETAKNDLEEDPETANYDIFLVNDGPHYCNQVMADNNVTNAEVQGLGNNIRFFAKIGNVVTTICC